MSTKLRIDCVVEQKGKHVVYVQAYDDVENKVLETGSFDYFGDVESFKMRVKGKMKEKLKKHQSTTQIKKDLTEALSEVEQEVV